MTTANPTRAKVVSLTVLPLHASHLCFSVSGILESLTARLGQTVAAFDLAGHYATVGADPAPTVPGDPSRLLYDVATIDPLLLSSQATLRAESVKAALTKAINARQNAYYAKYRDIAKIASEAQKYYSQSSSVPDSKPNRLQKLSELSHQQNSALQTQYSQDHRTGVVKATVSQLTSKTTTGGTDKSWGQSDETEEYGGLKQQDGTVSVATGAVPPPLSTDTQGPNYTFPLASVGLAGVKDSAVADVDFGATTEVSQSTGWADEGQTIKNTDYGYRIPSIESQAQNERAQISLLDEKWTTFMAFQNVDHLDVVLANELQSMDLTCTASRSPTWTPCCFPLSPA